VTRHQRTDDSEMISDERIAAEMLKLLRDRGPQKSACPSEIARLLFPDDWRSHMERVRRVAAEKARQGSIEFTQKGKVISPETVRGPIRLRLRASVSVEKRNSS